MAVSTDDVRRSIYALVRQNKVNSTIYSLVVPVLVGIFATFYTDIVKVHPLLFWAPVAVFVAFAIVAATITWDVKLAPEVYIELDDAKQAQERAEASIEYLTLVQEQAIVWNAMVRRYVSGSTKSASDLAEAIEEISTVIVENRTALFGCTASELWNFAVYLYAPQRGCLVPVWRDRHPDHPSEGRGREWMPGRGHVGLAFVDGTIKVTPDAHAPGVWELMNTLQDARRYDDEVYRSFVSVPLTRTEPVGPAFGVLVATSNAIGRFDKANALVLRHAAAALSTVLELGYDDQTLVSVTAAPETRPTT